MIVIYICGLLTALYFIDHFSIFFDLRSLKFTFLYLYFHSVLGCVLHGFFSLSFCLLVLLCFFFAFTSLAPFSIFVFDFSAGFILHCIFLPLLH